MASENEKLLEKAVKHYENGLVFDEYHIVNPHRVTSDQIYQLWNVNNTSDANKPVSNALQEAMDGKFSVSDIYNQLTDDGTGKDLASLPLSAAQGKNLWDTIDGLSNISETVDGYSDRITALEGVLKNA